MDDIKLFNEAFNKGYLLRKSDPNLTKSIMHGFTDPSQPYAEGFISGAKEQEREQKQNLEQFLTKEKERQKEAHQDSEKKRDQKRER